jgi:hypothetical protein
MNGHSNEVTKSIVFCLFSAKANQNQNHEGNDVTKQMKPKNVVKQERYNKAHS